MEADTDAVRRWTGTARLSACGTYRYSLTRVWDDALPILTWCMLNPSTASAWKDDATIRRCIGFAKLWGYGGIRVVNLFALRATHPEALKQHADPVGPENVEHLTSLTGDLLVAWGNSLPKLPATAEMKALVQRYPSTCLGLTKSGEPRHPVRLPYSTPRQVFRSETA